MNELRNTLETLRTCLRMLTFCELVSSLILPMANSALVRGEVKVRRRHFLDRFFKFVSLGVNLYITCVIYRRASHAGPLAPLCFARIMGTQKNLKLIGKTLFHSFTLK